MPTLRQRVDAFCKDAGAKVESTDKLRAQITSLKSELKKAKETFKNHMKEMKTASKTVKAPKVAKAPKAPKAPAPKVKQEVAMNPLPAETAEQRSRRLEGEMGPGGYAMAANGGGARRGSKHPEKSEERKAELAKIKELRDAYKSTNLAWRADPENEEKAKAAREAHAAYMAAKKSGGTRRHSRHRY